MSDRLKLPPERDFGFYQRRKHDKWRQITSPEPALEAAVADSHAHVHILPDPSWELVRCAANGVDFVCEICDPSEYMLDIPKAVRNWLEVDARALANDCEEGAFLPDDFGLPTVRISAGVHPHNAKLYDDAVEQRLYEWLAAPETVVVGEIGLDYHYDLSPRDDQRRVFRRQIQLAKELDMPIALHLRGGEDPQADDAHREAFEILQEVGFPPRGTIVHCCALPPDQLEPWVEEGCYIAYGGALTFKNADEARAGAKIVPAERLLLETDSPYMTPEPMRGAACTPAHVVFTAEMLARVRDCEPGEQRRCLLQQVHDNTLRFFGVIE